LAEKGTVCQLIRKSLSGRRLWKAGGTENLLIGSGAARGVHSGPAPDVNPVSGGIDAEVTELQGLEGTVPFGDPTTAGNADKRPACGNPSPAPGVLFGKEPTRHLQKTMLCVMKAVGIAVSGPSGPSDAVVQGLRGL